MKYSKNKCSFYPPLQRQGFTLAETLITLVIVGVIAALTVPTLIAKYQKEQTLTRLKKVYSALSQTTNKAIADNGPINTWNLGENKNVDDAKIFLKTYVTPYLNIIGEIKTNAEDNFVNMHTLSGEDIGDIDSFARFYLSDGTSVYAKILENTNNKRLYILVDINGDKKPNVQGKDIFQYNYYIANNTYAVLSGKFVPTGYQKESRTELMQGSSSCNKLYSGAYCAALIMHDGWQIKDDYPW